MIKDMDQLLKTALAPTDEPRVELNDQILLQVKERQTMAGKKKTYQRRIPAAGIAAACILVLCSGTAFAVYKYLTPAEVAQEVKNDTLQQAFLSEGAISVNETQESGGYRITLLGSVAGKNISDFIPAEESAGEAGVVKDDDRIYTVVAIERVDGTPMPDTSSDAYGEEPFYVSHYVHGLDPARYSIMSMNGGYTEFVREGIMYRLLEMDNIEMFADRGIYVGVSSGSFYDPDAYMYDVNSGEMSRNDNYVGVNALFELPVDKAKGDPAAAEAYLKNLQESWETPDEPVEKDASDLEVDEFLEKLTPENLNQYADPIESTRQTCTVEDLGDSAHTYLGYSYELENEAGGGMAELENLFPDGKPGTVIASSSYSDEGLKSLLMEVFTLNEDGTVTFVLYRMK